MFCQVRKYITSVVNKNKTKDKQEDVYREMMAPHHTTKTNYGKFTPLSRSSVGRGCSLKRPLFNRLDKLTS